MKKIVYYVMLATFVFVCVSGCDNSRTPQQRAYDKACDALVRESRDLGQAEERQKWTEKYIPFNESAEVRLRREQVEAAKQEVKRTAAM